MLTHLVSTKILNHEFTFQSLLCPLDGEKYIDSKNFVEVTKNPNRNTFN